MFTVRRYTGDDSEPQLLRKPAQSVNTKLEHLYNNKHGEAEEKVDAETDDADADIDSASRLSASLVSSSLSASFDSIVVLPQRKAKKLKEKHLRMSLEQNADDLAEQQQRREERRKEKKMKREARRAAERQETGTQGQGTAGSALSVGLTELKSLKNSTIKPTARTVVQHPLTSAPSTRVPGIRVGQQKKDPAVRAAERVQRKKQRMIADRNARGEEVGIEMIDVNGVSADAHRIQESEQDTFREAKRRRTETEISEQDGITPLSQLHDESPIDSHSSPLTEPSPSGDAVIREQRRLTARPSWMTRGSHIDSDVAVSIHAFSFHRRILQTLTEQGIQSFFPIQAEVMPVVIHTHGQHDICVNAPTGSGKTLLYLLPILHTLASRVCVKLRALILVPSRDLALQVKHELDVYAPPLGLRIGVAIGQQSFRKEQQMLMKVKRNLLDIWEETDPRYQQMLPASTDPPLAAASEYESNIDILVCTPGRLVDHLDGTIGFTLQHLQFLVIDEVDRLLSQYYSDWAARIHMAVTARSVSSKSSWTDELGIIDSIKNHSHRQQCQKILVSATLTGNPAKLASLHLHNPVFFTQSLSKRKKFSLPVGLKAAFILCQAQQKPLMLIHILHSLHLDKKSSSTTTSSKHPVHDQVLIFAASLESTHRLARLLSCYGSFHCAEYSSSLTQHQRSVLLHKFRSHQYSILICSDVMARGMDIPTVSHVINYDVPIHLSTYIHRVGRTARANMQGHAITIVKHTEYLHFIQMLKNAANSYLTRMPATFNLQQDEQMINRYIQALKQLKQILREERQGTLGKLDMIPRKLQNSRIQKSDIEEQGSDDEEEHEEEQAGIDPEEWKFRPVESFLNDPSGNSLNTDTAGSNQSSNKASNKIKR